ncbi:MAG: peptidoglycan-binding protein [Flavobacteriales bacterium]|nr:peptidoglycan-binding protein [Flavobacteriales bacterium]
MILKYGSKGKEVKELQEFLCISTDGHFGRGTESAVKTWQANNKLIADGIVGPATWDAMGLATTDAEETTYITENGLLINRHMLPKGEYMTGSKPEYVFLHHTAGWHNPFNTVDNWSRDTRGKIATEFVLGGQSIKGNDDKYDGVLVQCTPEGGWGWHLGTGGSHMHQHSVGIEVNNFGWIKDGKTYVGTRAAESQIVTLDKPFRGYKTWQRYSNKQIEVLRDWILWIGERDGIDICEGLPTLIKSIGADAFEYIPDVKAGKLKGVWTHTNVRKDKVDMFPQPELMDMLVSL